jgi:hypothetical protein
MFADVVLMEDARKNAESLIRYYENLQKKISGRLKDLEREVSVIVESMNPQDKEDYNKLYESNLAIASASLSKYKQIKPDFLKVIVSFETLVSFISLRPSSIFENTGTELKNLSRDLARCSLSDSEETYKLIVEFIEETKRVVTDAKKEVKLNKELALESRKYIFLREKLMSDFSTAESVLKEFVKDFLADMVRLPINIIIIPIAKLLANFATRASNIISSVLAPFVKVINKISNLWSSVIPTALTNMLSRAGINNPILTMIIQHSFKIVLPFALQFTVLKMTMISSKAALISASFISTLRIASTIKSAHALAESISEYSKMATMMMTFRQSLIEMTASR